MVLISWSSSKKMIPLWVNLLYLHLLPHLIILNKQIFFFHNTLFTLNLGKDEIGFELRIFDGEKQQKYPLKLLSGDNTVMMVIWIVILILLGAGGWFLVMRSRRRKMNEDVTNSLSIVEPVTTEMNPVYAQPTVQSVIENTPTPPELPQDILAQAEAIQKQDDNIIRS